MIGTRFASKTSLTVHRTKANVAKRLKAFCNFPTLRKKLAKSFAASSAPVSPSSSRPWRVEIGVDSKAHSPQMKLKKCRFGQIFEMFTLV